MTISRSKTGMIAGGVLGMIFGGVLAMSGVFGASGADADVIAAKAVLQQAGAFRFDVTIAHPDSGWEHYADAFEILDGDGNVLGTRTLAHPHVDEQPFTRSLLGVVIPQGAGESHMADLRLYSRDFRIL